MMADNHSPQIRSYNMSRIKCRNTRPEEIVRRYLFSKGLRYRKNDSRYPGKPDIVLPKYRTAVFVHGCFWHCHEGCADFVTPKSNTDYWVPKLEHNRQRDIASIDTLLKAGWRVLVVWECELKKAVREERLNRLYEEITNSKRVIVKSGVLCF
jgi:DNA mismatch endonuclease (patch repair protein)